MRRVIAVVVALMTLLFPKVSMAQAYAYGAPAPDVTAATADWQTRSEPILVDGLIYFPTRAFRIFDSRVMAASGVYAGVPVYADVTLEPFSIIYVPVSSSNMRVYERRRDGALAGTTGSRTPSFPVEIASSTVLENTQRANMHALPPNAATVGVATPQTQIAASRDAAAAAVGADPQLTPAPTSTTGDLADRPRMQRTRIEMIPTPIAKAPDGVWLEFDGSRWYAAGAAVPFTPERFEPIGQYRGFAVYRDKQGARDQIWVLVVKDGPVAPYSKR